MAVNDLELVTYEGLDERIVIIRAGDEVDSVFVQTERFNVLVDTLGTPAQCAQAQKLLSDRLQGRPLIAINSHMDWDHFWGNAGLPPQTPIIAHKAALERLNGLKIEQELADKQTEEARFADVKVVPPTQTFSGGSMLLHGGDLTLELIHTPGHTPDHISVWIPELRTCLAVDAVEDPIPEVWSQSPEDLKNLCASLKKIRGLKARFVVLAHGQTANPEVLEKNIQYFENLQDATTTMRSGEPVQEALHEQPGFRLEDLTSLPADMSLDTAAFYRQFHKSKLDAALAARNSDIVFV
ncbi:MBL fold metallo-hydrolase [Roseibium denhamense]|uniref:MBL fold metallo-hydrolase n=1 Tax=Roseibium denhamense TaxID=76305 RepID=UPI0012BCEEAA|nr:MBL fold metallo-hydrolase [Roseibium denhamense]MTI04590.1 MBL fold metallo-hydrolase [Roseibium denhamense]